MATKPGGFFSVFSNIVSDLQQRVNRTLFRSQNPAHGVPPTTAVPPTTRIQQSPPWISDDSDKLVYQQTKTELKEIPQGEKQRIKSQSPLEQALEKGTQLEQWQELQKQTPVTPETTENPIKVPFIPISRPVRPISIQTEKVATPDISREQYLLALVSRPKSWQDRIVDGLKDAIPFLPKSHTSEERLEDAINQLIAQNPEFANSEEVRVVKDSKKGILEEVETLTGQVKDVRFVPPKSYDYEQPRIGSGDHVFNLNISPSSNIVRIAQEPFNRFISPKFAPVLKQFAGSAAQNAASQSAILGRGLISGAARGLSSGLLRTAMGAGRLLAIFAGGGQAAAIGGGALALILILVIALPLVLNNTGPIFTQRAALSSAGGTGDVLAKGNQYISIEISSSKNTLKNEELPQDVTFTVTVKPKKQPFQEDPNISATITASGKDGTKTLVSESWSEETHQINLKLENLEDVNVILAVSVSARVEEQPDSQTAANNASIRVGNPPDDCPSGWATTYGTITSEPNDSVVSTHRTAEAIDIGNSPKGRIQGAPIYATSRGVTSFNCYSSLYGNCVRITTSCNGKTVEIIYAHMMNRSVQDGQGVSSGTQIGSVGATGNVFGSDPNHLHYEFLKISGSVTIPMAPPYIPLHGKRGTTW
ncbi:MAG: M23 family metallopeptidase [Candidatus Blackburnbacteria bacterium]|nr:M23 family metallopeptidase [Candidatus Blackburnbacteria bacterium]